MPALSICLFILLPYLVSVLTQLQTLDLSGCSQLTSLPDLSVPLRLNMLGLCEQLVSLIDLSALTQLRTLHFMECTQLASLPDLSALTQLQTLLIVRCSQLTSLPDLSALTQLQTLTIADCKQLTSLPDLSALTQLQKPDLGKGARKCDQLSVEQQARAQAVVAANRERAQRRCALTGDVWLEARR